MSTFVFVETIIEFTITVFQNPNEDTEWNDVLRSKGILPPKEKEISEDEIVNMIEQTIQQKQAESEKSLVMNTCCICLSFSYIPLFF